MLVVRNRRAPNGSATETLAPFNRLGQFFNDFGLTMDAAPATDWAPAIDMFEEAEAFRVLVELPGVRSEDLQVSIENNTLSVRGQRNDEHRPDVLRYYRRERWAGAFSRSFELPTSVDAERIEARYDAGILSVTLPKADSARPREIPIQVSHTS